MKEFFLTRWLPVALPVLLFLWALSGLLPKHHKADQFGIEEFGRLPILCGGRIQPIDSLARNSLLQLREKQSANVAPWESNPKILSATEWIMIMMMKPAEADAIPVFRIDNPDLKGLLGLPMNADREAKRDGKHFSWNDIKGKLEDLQNEAQRAGRVADSKQTPYDQAVLRLINGIGIYMKLQNALQPQNARDWSAELTSYLDNLPAGVAAARAQQAGKEYDEQKLTSLMSDMERFDAMASIARPKPGERSEAVLLIPPSDPETSPDAWQQTGDALIGVAQGKPLPFAVTAYAHMATAYATGNVAGFNDAVSGYQQSMAGVLLRDLNKAASEQRFNSFEPFYKAMTPYIVAFVFVLLFWLEPRWDWARKTAVWLVVAGLVIHTSGLIYRMALEGRPPVTNLYSSAIFIGFGAVILGIVLEAFWRNGIGLVISSALGFVSLIIAHHLSLSGDTMEMLRAVLDTNFWLATHVVVVTLGYASTFVAGFLAVVYVLLGFFTPRLGQQIVTPDGPANSRAQPEMGKSLAKMVYGIVCFATLFSFVGTVLGGIWADQSWGRFWGWDPKENGALMIVLWNALILHARWGGMIRERGLMCMAIFGNIVTSWSWFGVNMLGIGLHAYGFTSAAFTWLLIFASSQAALILLGLLPFRFWRSFRKPEDEPPPAEAVPAQA